MERRAILMLLVTVVMFMFLTRDDVVVMGDSHSCFGGEISDDGTHSAYVAHVLSELATVTPTIPPLVDVTIFPGNGAIGSVAGIATCSDPNDPGLCASCLSELQQLLLGSCSTWAAGYAEQDSVCDMRFRIA
ncbi:unnamed protein product [Linum tenue]|uniref:Gnk2-homologous domain-containing protein n=1 Tax=Linum tenue TaxID=586396 RepID=A0AAV0JLJ5_9ROSI|nr:unnamed protein product [Linum tenue]